MDVLPFADTDQPPPAYLATTGAVFTLFDARTQDSGNVSFGVEAAGRRWFLKTAGDPAGPASFLPHGERVALLLNAGRLARSTEHPALARLRAVVKSGWGPMLVYEWAEGELVRTPADQRSDPACAFQRFRRLPPEEAAAAIDLILDAHVALGAQGWVAGDFYDGSIIYDFSARRLRLIDLDSYRQGPFINEMGRLFGSTRFMAPEEFERGARIDQRTTVFNLGRAIAEFLGDGGLGAAEFRGTRSQHAVMTRACASDPVARFQSIEEMAQAWRS